MLNLKKTAYLMLLTLQATSAASVMANEISDVEQCLKPEGVFLKNGKVITLNASNQIAHSVLIRGNKIVNINAKPKNLKCTTVIDLKGKTVIPGLIDSHLHFVRQGQVPGWDVRATESSRTLPDFLKIISNSSQHINEGELITVIGGFNPTQFPEKRLPTRDELDNATSVHPVYIQTGFAGPAVTNSAGVKLFKSMGVDISTDGTFRAGNATNQAYKSLQRLQDFDSRMDGIKNLMAYANSLGITTVFDEGGTGFPGASFFNPRVDYLPLYTVHQREQMTLRVRLQHTSTEKADESGLFQKSIVRTKPTKDDTMLSFSSTGEHIVSFPIGGKVNAYYLNQAQKVASLGLSHEQHSVSLPENEQHLAMISKVHKKTPIDQLRWSLSHVFELGAPGTESLVADLKRMKMGLRVQNHGYHSKTDKFPLGRVLKSDNAGPLYRTLLDQGIPLGAGSDGALLGPMNPWASIYYMVTGKNNRGRQVNPGQHVTRLEALTMYTKGNAWFSFEEDALGSIEPGKLADLIVLDKDYLSIPEDEIPSIRSELTIMNGRVVFTK